MSRETFARVKALRGRPTVPGDSGRGPSARGVTQLSRDLVSGPSGQPAFPGYSGPCPRAHGFNQHLGRLWTVPEVPQCRIAFPGDLRLVSRQTGSTSCPGPILSGSEGPRGHKAVPGAPARARSPAGWTCSPGPHALTSKSLRGRPAELGAWGPGPNALGIDQLSQVTGARVRMPVESTTFPGDSAPSRRVRVVDQAFG